MHTKRITTKVSYKNIAAQVHRAQPTLLLPLILLTNSSLSTNLVFTSLARLSTSFSLRKSSARVRLSCSIFQIKLLYLILYRGWLDKDTHLSLLFGFLSLSVSVISRESLLLQCLLLLLRIKRFMIVYFFSFFNLIN